MSACADVDVRRSTESTKFNASYRRYRTVERDEFISAVFMCLMEPNR